MKRVAITLVALGAAIVPAGGALAGKPKGDPAAKLVACHRAAAQVDRALEVRARMKAFGGVERMWIRFELRRHALKAGGAWTTVPGPGLGVWNRSARGVGAYRFDKRIDNLPAGAYRVRVSFRWYGSGAQLRQRAQRLTSTCRQPDSAPDLAIGQIKANATSTGHARYLVPVRNLGESLAKPFDVTLRVNGDLQTPQTVSELDAEGRRVLQFDAPACAPGTQVTAAADPDDQVREADEQNNARSITCPLG